MDELSGTENRIAVERMRYNESDAGVQHVAPAVPGERHGEDVRLQGVSVLRGAARSEAGAEGQLSSLSRTAVRSPAALGTAALERPPVRGAPASGTCSPTFASSRVAARPDRRARAPRRRRRRAPASRGSIGSSARRPSPFARATRVGRRSSFRTSAAARSWPRCSSCSPAIRTPRWTRPPFGRRSPGSRAAGRAVPRSRRRGHRGRSSPSSPSPSACTADARPVVVRGRRCDLRRRAMKRSEREIVCVHGNGRDAVGARPRSDASRAAPTT